MQRVTIDLRAAGGTGVSGVHTYLREVVPRLLSKRGVEWTVFWNSATEAFPAWLNVPARVRKVVLRKSNLLLNMGLATGAVAADQWTGGGVFFMPDVRPVTLRKSALVVTVHDVSLLRYPEFFSWKSRAFFRLVRLPRLLRDAKVVLTPSRSIADEVVDFFAAAEGKVVVTPLGADGVARAKGADMARVRKRYALPKEFVLHLGTVEPRKNIGLFVASAREAGVPAVVAGEGNARVFAAEGREMGAQYIGRVTEEDKGALLRMARHTVITSHYEGCGLPALEALFAGGSVVARDIPVLREVLGERARYGVTVAQLGAALREPSMQVGRGVTPLPCWDGTAERTMEVLMGKR